MPVFDLGEAEIEIPEEATPEQRRAIVAKFMQTPEFDQLVDKRTGAPGKVRMLVGSAPEQDRLANLQRFYPDATPYGDANFVFTDPDSGRPTLYNPSGLDVGDVAAVAREGAQVFGSALGAAGGALSGLATGPGAIVASPVAAAYGAGLGSVGAATLFDLFADQVGGRIDTRSLPKMTLDAALDFMAAAGGQRAGELIGEGIKKAAGGLSSAATGLVDSFRRLKIEPPGGAVTGSKALQTVERTLESTPFSADVMQKQAETILAQTKAAADDLAMKFGPVQTKEGAGQVIKEAAVKSAERFKFTQERAYAEAFDLVGADTPVAVDSIKALRVRMQGELLAAPASLAKALNPAINLLKGIEDDAAKNGGGVAFDAFRQVRTMVGREIADPLLAGSSGAQNEALKRVYGALTEDMSDAAKLAGPDAAKKLAVADRFTRFFMNTADKTLEKINRFEADDRAFQFAMTSAKDGGLALTRLRRHFQPEEWDTVAGTVLGRMGLARPGAQDATGEAFSVNTFLTNWNRLAPEAKEALFGGSRYADLRPALDDLVDVVGSLKGVERLANTSNTGRVVNTYLAMQALFGALGGAVVSENDTTGALAGVATTVLAPRAVAKLITNPSFVKWLTTPVTNPTGMSAHVGRLTAIAEAEPVIQEEIGQFISALRSIPATP